MVATTGDMALTLDCPRGMSSGPCGQPQTVWGAGELGRWHNRGWWGTWLIKKPPPKQHCAIFVSRLHKPYLHSISE